ncbi:MAG: prepilin-type N-terminal cleavage/methylation domain-containing protein [Oligoflexia bacterium]|nr:prepilin-type N-terminal cleavage/methylation domain-containing protein [Oligoflexia bacterium]
MRKGGFTLLELVIVLAIIGMVVGIGIPQIKRVFRTNLKTASVQIAGMIKFAYDSAVIKHRIHRIVFDFDKGVYFLEISESDVLIAIDEEEEREEDEDGEADEEKKVQRKGFARADGEMGRTLVLPSGIMFDSVENLNTKKKITEGVANLYFFPQGYTESLIIRLTGGTTNTGFYSIRVNPINAKCEIEGRYIEI